MTELYAEHIIGLRALEHVRLDDPKSAMAVRARHTHIQADGVLRPKAQEVVGEDGSVFAIDRLAGDSNYIFLSYGPRYRQMREAHLCYGFLFDARQLIEECGALVGPDMMEDYEDLLSGIIQEIDASLPPLPMATDEEIAEFSRLMGEDDPALLAYVQEKSVSRYHDIDTAVRLGDMSVEGAAEAVTRFQAAVPDLQKKHRQSGAAAIALLRPGMEIMIPAQLSLKYAIGMIKKGVIYENQSG